MAWAVLLVLSLGLQRMLVVCTGPDCDQVVEFVHTSGGCCDHADHAPAKKCCPGDDEGEVARSGHGGCTDVALDVDQAPLPQRVVFVPHAPPCLAPPIVTFAAVPQPRAITVRPPGTGPPRADRRTELIASTLLLL